ncbi:MAG TPA: AsmA family protein, partial [Acidobacteria bacterium]|nr:AsmA family protein [Acidobacteriota bacterium]
MASKLLRRTLGLAGVLVVLVGLGVLYLLNADLGWSRDLVTGVASKALGRQLRVAGAFHLRLGRVTRLVADDVSLANAPWAEEHDLVAIAHCDVALETRSLLSGPVHLLHLELAGVELHLERNADGETSWTARHPATEPRSGGHPSLPQIDRLELRDLHVIYRSPARAKPFQGELSVARADSDEKGVVGLDLEGVLDGLPLHLKGHVGPLREIVSGKAFRQDLTFRLGTVEGRLRGTTASLSTLAGSSLDLSLRGPDLAEPLAMLGITAIPGGAFAVEATTRPAGAALDTRLQVTAPLLEIETTGRILPGKPPQL